MRPLSRGVVVSESVSHKVCEGMRHDQVQVFNAEISHHRRKGAGANCHSSLLAEIAEH
jgi:hypothetical protein